MLGMDKEDVVVLPRWAAELCPNHILTPPPQRKRGRRYDGKGSGTEMRTGHSTIVVKGKTDSA